MKFSLISKPSLFFGFFSSTVFVPGSYFKKPIDVTIQTIPSESSNPLLKVDILGNDLILTGLNG